MVVTLEVRSIISSHNLGNAMFTENLLYVYNLFAGAPDKRGFDNMVWSTISTRMLSLIHI